MHDIKRKKQYQFHVSKHKQSAFNKKKKEKKGDKTQRNMFPTSLDNKITSQQSKAHSELKTRQKTRDHTQRKINVRNIINKQTKRSIKNWRKTKKQNKRTKKYVFNKTSHVNKKNYKIKATSIQCSQS